jgi:predicted flavoprotein YhiN
LFYVGGEAFINFIPGFSVEELISAGRKENKKFSLILGRAVPLRLAKTLLGVYDIPLSNAPGAALNEIKKILTEFRFVPAPLSYAKAEVTAGGVNTREINPSTMESRKTPGLYFLGEVLDVTGKVGGYNLHWAWASAYCAAQSLNKKLF